MPLYDFQCQACDLEFEEMCSIDERSLVICRECGGKVKQLIGKPPGLSLFRPGFYEHVSAEGAWCDTPQQLRDACEANGNRSVYLENSIFKTENRHERE